MGPAGCTAAQARARVRALNRDDSDCAGRDQRGGTDGAQ